MFWIIVLLQNPSSLQFEVMNRWPDIVLQDFLVEFMVPFITASLPGPEAAKQPQTITLPPPYFTVGMMFFFLKCCATFMPDVYTHLPKSSTFVSSVHRVFSQKSRGSSRCFLAKLRQAFIMFLLSCIFRLGTLPCRPFLLFLVVES